MPEIELAQHGLNGFLFLFLTAFLQLSKLGGRIFQDPVIVRLQGLNVGRAPDLMIFLPENDAEFGENAIYGTPDLMIEIVSPNGGRRDRLEKFREYELAGVPEYWILDDTFREAAFYQLNEQGEYECAAPNAEGIYASRALPNLNLVAALLWSGEYPSYMKIARLVEGMLTDEESR